MMARSRHLFIGLHESFGAMLDNSCPHNRTVSCSDCMLSRLCIPIALESDDIDRLDEIVARGKPFEKGETVYDQGEAFTSLYAVRSGSIKTVRLSSSGVEQITGFYFPGEVIGLDGIGGNRYTNSAVALESVSICKLPYNRLADLSLELPSLQRHCMELMSNEIATDHELHTLLSKGSAQTRLASFLLNLSARNARRRLSTTDLRLTMSRGDIGNYLGLTLESVSRLMRQFQDAELIDVANKEIRIRNTDGLSELTL